jgi:hypothetical protein
MTSKREAILDAIATTLTGNTTAGARVWRSRAEALSRNEAPAIVIEPAIESTRDPEATGATSFGILDWQLTVRFGVITRGAIPDQLADPILVEIHQLLMASSAIAALTLLIYPTATRWEAADGDGTAGVTICDWIFRYRTGVNDISI